MKSHIVVFAILTGLGWVVTTATAQDSAEETENFKAVMELVNGWESGEKTLSEVERLGYFEAYASRSASASTTSQVPLQASASTHDQGRMNGESDQIGRRPRQSSNRQQMLTEEARNELGSWYLDRALIEQDVLLLLDVTKVERQRARKDKITVQLLLEAASGLCEFLGNPWPFCRSQ